MDIYHTNFKHCHKCNTTKPTTEFFKNNKKKDGCKVHCKSCNQTYQTNYFKDKKEQAVEHRKQFRKCRLCKLEQPIENFGTPTKCNSCAETIKQQKLHDKQQKSAIRKEQYKQKYNGMLKHRRDNDPVFRLAGLLRNRISQSFLNNGFSKQSKTYELLGCDFQYLKEYIEAQFNDGISWDNKHEWHIDHIVPLSFAISEYELCMLSHYSNLRPLLAADNIRKGKTLTHDALTHPIYESIVKLRSA